MTAEVAANEYGDLVPATWDCQSVELGYPELGRKVDNTTIAQFSNEKDWKYTGRAADFTYTSAIKDGGMVQDMVNDWQVSNS